MDNLAWLDANALAQLIRAGELHPSEAVEAAIARFEALNPRLNAVITPPFEQAREQATRPDLPDGPFRGVPLLLKDYLCQTQGYPFYEGMRCLREVG
jgi:amidase